MLKSDSSEGGIIGMILDEHSIIQMTFRPHTSIFKGQLPLFVKQCLHWF